MSWPGRLLVLADAFGATQEISFRRPLAGTEVQFQPRLSDPAAIPARLADCAPDMLILSRYSGSDGPVWAACARARGVPVLAHLDDDLLAVPPSLGARKFRDNNAPGRVAARRANLDAADLVYASTPALAAALAGHGIRRPIRAGSLYCSVDPGELGRAAPPATGPVIGYMGTAGHAADLAMIEPVLSRLLRLVPELRVEVFGTIELPEPLRRFGSRVAHLPPVGDYAGFLERLRRLGWWVGLAPLADTAFNRCKAATKWVELSLAGMPVLASEGPVYRAACAGGAGELAGDAAAWEAALLRLLGAPALRRARVAAAQDKLLAGYGHAHLAAQLAEMFAAARCLAAGRGSG